jgi:hypothetical protein
MKVYLSKPRYHWISPYTIIDYIFFWKSWSSAFKDKYDESITDHPEWVERWADRLVPISEGIQWVLNKIHPPIQYIKIDYWDTWSMDQTLSPIILIMLKQLKAHKHGYGLVDDEDVPDEIKSTQAPSHESWEWDDNAEKRYEYILNEMIWTFEQLCDLDNDSKFFNHSGVDKSSPFNVQLSQMTYDKEGYTIHHNRIQNGCRLFGKYFQTLWD